MAKQQPDFFSFYSKTTSCPAQLSLSDSSYRLLAPYHKTTYSLTHGLHHTRLSFFRHKRYAEKTYKRETTTNKHQVCTTRNPALEIWFERSKSRTIRTTRNHLKRIFRPNTTYLSVSKLARSPPNQATDHQEKTPHPKPLNPQTCQRIF
jgi:hypothetical protein